MSELGWPGGACPADPLFNLDLVYLCENTCSCVLWGILEGVHARGFLYSVHLYFCASISVFKLVTKTSATFNYGTTEGLPAYKLDYNYKDQRTEI